MFDKLPKKFKHTTAKDLGLATQKRGVKNLIANHINPRYNKGNTLGIKDVHDEIVSEYKGNLYIANDFDIYYLDRDGTLYKYET